MSALGGDRRPCMAAVLSDDERNLHECGQLGRMFARVGWRCERHAPAPAPVPDPSRTAAGVYRSGLLADVTRAAAAAVRHGLALDDVVEALRAGARQQGLT